MAVMIPREKWTDERLDDLNKKVDDGFADVRTEFRALRSEMNGRFEALKSEMDARFDALNARFDALNRNLLVVAGAIIAALIGTNVF